MLWDEAVPATLRGVEDACCFLASGQFAYSVPCNSSRFGPTDRVGGIYVFRFAPDAPEPYKRDDYLLIPSSSYPEVVWIDGPYKHPTDHWLSGEDVSRQLSVCVI